MPNISRCQLADAGQRQQNHMQCRNDAAKSIMGLHRLLRVLLKTLISSVKHAVVMISGGHSQHISSWQRRERAQQQLCCPAKAGRCRSVASASCTHVFAIAYDCLHMQRPSADFEVSRSPYARAICGVSVNGLTHWDAVC